MIFSELYAAMADKCHRKDMGARIPKFADSARQQINLRLGLLLVPPVDDTETNEILTDWPLLYFYAGMAELYEFIEEYETASYFIGKWDREVDRYYITRAGTEPLVIIAVDDTQETAP